VPAIIVFKFMFLKQETESEERESKGSIGSERVAGAKKRKPLQWSGKKTVTSNEREKP